MYELTAVVAHVAGDASASESKDSQEAEGHLIAHIRVRLYSMYSYHLHLVAVLYSIESNSCWGVHCAALQILHVHLHVHVREAPLAHQNARAEVCWLRCACQRVRVQAHARRVRLPLFARAGMRPIRQWSITCRWPAGLHHNFFRCRCSGL